MTSREKLGQLNRRIRSINKLLTDIIEMNEVLIEEMQMTKNMIKQEKKPIVIRKVYKKYKPVSEQIRIDKYHRESKPKKQPEITEYAKKLVDSITREKKYGTTASEILNSYKR